MRKARKTYGFMMESLERRELLTSAVEDVVLTDPQAPSDIVIAADITPAPVAAPTGLNITNTFSTSLIVAWTDESASESGHRIERSIDSAVWTTAGTVGPNITSFHDTGLSPNTAYYYRVVAFDFLSEMPSDAITGSTSSQSLQVGYNTAGLSNITYNGTALLDLAASPKDGFFIYDYKIIKPDGTAVVGRGDLGFTTSWDMETHTLTYNYTWGRIVTQYVQDVDRLNLIITVTNKSLKNTLAGVNIIPFIAHFPDFPIGFDASDPKVGYNIDGPTVIAADWQTGMLAATNDDVVKPLYVGFLTSPDTATQHKYLYWVGSSPFWCQPGNWTKFDRTIVPGGSDQYTVSLRFAPTGTTTQQIAP
ncbi:MAG TPA: fibronectin type III domain-containing protein, partial [Tepidisphaeraceae bacterium]|nr:fibronectin type III domain-containing protein [Tepidisphaeraceae bacterium]